MPPVRPPRDPYADAPVGELSDPLLPRWFVLLAVLAVPAAIAVAVWAFVAFGTDEVPVAERRPPPEGALTTAVGELVVGDRPAEPVPDLCPLLDGVRAGGTAADRAVIAEGLAALCDVDLPLEPAQRLQAFAQAGGVVRFAQFQATAVDSTLDTAADPPVVLLNARLARGVDPAWVAPLVVHDTTYLRLDAGSAAAALAARQVEAAVCDQLFADEGDQPPGCRDAAALLGLDDPEAALREAGFS